MVSTLEKRRESGLYWKQGCLCVREWSNLEKKRLHITYILISISRFFNIKYKTLILANDFEEFISKNSLSLWTSPCLIFLWHKFRWEIITIKNFSTLITNHCFCTFVFFLCLQLLSSSSFRFCRTSHHVWPLHLFAPNILEKLADFFVTCNRVLVLLFTRCKDGSHVVSLF